METNYYNDRNHDEDEQRMMDDEYSKDALGCLTGCLIAFIVTLCIGAVLIATTI